MKHAVLSPTLRDALRLASAITDAGHHARVITVKGRQTGVIIHAPLAVVEHTCRRVGFEPGRAVGA